MSSTTFTTHEPCARPLGDGGRAGDRDPQAHALPRPQRGAGLRRRDGPVVLGPGRDHNDDRRVTPDPSMQQATVNLLADMGVQPATLQSGLVAATASTDTTAPTSTITSPAAGASIQSGTTVTITGTATDAGGGVVAGVEVSVDGGVTWHPATGRSSLDLHLDAQPDGTVTIKSRAVDDSGNLETPVGGHRPSPSQGPISIWSNSAVPGVTAADGDASAIELGVKFRSDVAGFITGLRFYKGAANTGTHVGSLWTITGHAAGPGHLHRRDGHGLAAGPVLHPGRDLRQHHLRRVLPHQRRPLCLGRPTTSPMAGSRMARSMHSRMGPMAAMASMPIVRRAVFPTDTYHSENYYVDVVFDTNSLG